MMPHSKKLEREISGAVSRGLVWLAKHHQEFAGAWSVAVRFSVLPREVASGVQPRIEVRIDSEESIAKLARQFDLQPSPDSEWFSKWSAHGGWTGDVWLEVMS